MSAAADTPVQEKIELPGDVGQPGVAPSGHNQMGDHGPALGQTVEGSRQMGDHGPALGQTVG